MRTLRERDSVFVARVRAAGLLSICCGLAAAYGCSSSDDAAPVAGVDASVDAGGHSDATLPNDASGGKDTGSGSDAVATDSSPSDAGPQTDADAAAIDARPVDPFAGVWAGPQGAETWTASNAHGCGKWQGFSADASLCDECTGTYTLIDAGVASATFLCVPMSGCSVSVAHTDIGTFTIAPDGGQFTYDYDFGGGTNSFTGFRTATPPGDVCASIDAGTD